VSFLATAYKGMPPAISAKLEAVLLDSITSSNESVRLCAVQWATRLFPFAHPPARYVCVLGAGDKRFDVREEAARGLKPQAGSSKTDTPKVRRRRVPTDSSCRHRLCFIKAAGVDSVRPKAREAAHREHARGAACVAEQATTVH
jgi:hypothetical protein